LTDPPSQNRSAEAALLAEEQKRHLTAAMMQLPPRERAAIVLREIEGLSTAEVAEILGSSEVTVRSQISRAIARLRQILAGGQQ
jgi:RNA polymerase sigma-70 factor (ECF subfamily)